MKRHKGEQLIEELLSNPDSFFKYGKSNDLLQEYFAGLSLETLIPLLKSNDERIQKPTIWIVSELANQACPLLRYVVPLVNSKDKYIRYYAFECILLCATGNQIKEFVHLICGINDDESAIRILVMKLLSNAEETQLRSGIELVAKMKIDSYELHQYGLSRLSNPNQIDEQGIIDMLNSSDRLTQQYGIMLGKKRYKNYPKVIEYALLNGNYDIKKFAQMIIDGA